MKRTTKLFLTAIVILMAYLIFSKNKEKNELITYLEYSQAKVLRYEYGSRDWSLEYCFYVDGVKYNGNTSVSYFKCDNGQDGCVGQFFKVGYSENNPSINEINLGKYNKYKTSVRAIFK